MPELYPDLLPYWQAFNHLSNSRHIGFGLGYIPFSEIISYLNEIGIDSHEERQDYIKWIQFIDSKFVEISGKNKKKDTPSRQAPRRPPPARRSAPPRRQPTRHGVRRR